MNALFYFHSGQNALVFPSPETGKPCLVSTAVLRNLGWSADDAFLREHLPRADTTPLLLPDPRMKGVIGHVGSIMGPLTGGPRRQR